MIATKDGLELSNIAHEIREIWLDDIQTEGTQSRAGLNERTVAEYAELMEAGTEMPPVVVFWDGERYWLADGFHRLAAAKKVDTGVTACDVRQGTVRDALKFSLGSNSEHGLRRSNADKRHAVQLALADQEWSALSNRAIAELCGVSDPFVGKVKEGQVLTVSTSTSDEPQVKVGLDGKNYPAKKAAPVNRISGGTTFDVAQIEAATERKPAANGACVIDRKAVKIAQTSLSALVRAFTDLDLLDEFRLPLNHMMVRVKELRSTDQSESKAESDLPPQQQADAALEFDVF